jgi:DNA (cytosine-5)-methyltransferase 1
MIMNKFRIADLFSGGGGAAMGLHRAGFDVTGFDINPQKNYPFKFHQQDALTVDLSGFDAVWASPPCQAYTKKAASWGRERKHFLDHPDLVEPTREKLDASGLPYIIENVPGAPINAGLLLCGSMFDLRIIKHRLFETNWELPILGPAGCYHGNAYNPWQGAGRSADKLRAAMGIDWLPISGGASRKAGYTGDLFNAIPPAYSEYLGRLLMKQISQPCFECGGKISADCEGAHEMYCCGCTAKVGLT